jgi:hypothetical protein
MRDVQTSICNSVIIQSSENCYLYQSLEPARHRELPVPYLLGTGRRGGRASNRANLGIGNQKTNFTCIVKLFNYKWTSFISQAGGFSSGCTKSPPAPLFERGEIGKSSLFERGDKKAPLYRKWRDKKVTSFRKGGVHSIR